MQLFREGGSRFEQAFGSEEGVALIMDRISPNPMSLEEVVFITPNQACTPAAASLLSLWSVTFDSLSCQLGARGCVRLSSLSRCLGSSSQ
jgi:hypothetical protein